MITDFAMNFIKVAYSMADASAEWSKNNPTWDEAVFNDEKVKPLLEKLHRVQDIADKRYATIDKNYLEQIKPLQEGARNILGRYTPTYNITLENRPEEIKHVYLKQQREKKLLDLLQGEKIAPVYDRYGNWHVPASVSKNEQRQYKKLLRKVRAMPDEAFLGNFDADSKIIKDYYDKAMPIEWEHKKLYSKIFNRVAHAKAKPDIAIAHAHQAYDARRSAEIQNLYKQHNPDLQTRMQAIVDNADAKLKMENAALEREIAEKEARREAERKVNNVVANAGKDSVATTSAAVKPVSRVSRYGIGAAGLGLGALGGLGLYYLSRRNKDR